MKTPAIEIRSYSGEVEQHQHDFHQVILPCSGTLELEVEHRAGVVANSVGSFVHAGHKHSFVARRADTFIVLDLRIGTGTQAMEDGSVPPFFAIGADVQGLVDYMAALDARAGLSPSVCDAWSTLLLDRLAGQLRSPDRADYAVAQAIAFMKRNLAHPIRVRDIAEAAAMSPTRLHEAFLRRRATTPHAQLMALRLDAAERMLADPGLSIAEVAIRSGHADQSALTRIMRRERGTTPAAFRQSLLGRSVGKA